MKFHRIIFYCLFFISFQATGAAQQPEPIQDMRSARELIETVGLEPLQGGFFVDDLTVRPEAHVQAEPLTLDEATKITLARNLEIQIVRTERLIEAREEAIAKAIYDTQAELEGRYEQDLQQRSSVVLGSRELEGEVKTAIQKKIPLGTTVRVEGATRRNSTDTAFAAFDRYYSSFLTLSVEQPLLKNAFGYTDRKKIDQVKINIEKFDYETLWRIEEAVYETRIRYWDLVFAYENLLARRKALRKAQDFLEITRDQLDIGLTEKPDVYAAEANVRTRVLEVLEAETNLHAASNAVKVALNTPEVELVLPIQVPPYEPVTLVYDVELQKAFESRWDLAQAELDIKKQEIEIKIRKNELLPDLSFEGKYASTGLDREMASVMGEAWGFNHPQYAAIFRMTSSLEKRDERGRHAQAKWGLENMRRRLEALRLEIGREIDDRFRALTLAADKVRQLNEIQRLQRQKLAEEEKNFSRGRSDSKTIIDYHDDVLEAVINALQAEVDYAKALEALYRAENRLLERVHVTRNAALGEEGEADVPEDH